MSTRKLFFILASFCLVALTSCNKDDIDDLEDRLDKVENALGTNEPLTITFNTKDYNDAAVSIEREFLFKTSGPYYDYFVDNGDGTFWVYLERFSDVNWEEGANIEFLYNATTKEASSVEFRIYVYDENGNWISRRFDPDSYENNTAALTVTEFNTQTGVINLSVTASTTNEASNNAFEGKAMSGTAKFKGKLKERQGE